MAIKLNITADEIELKTNRLESLDNVKEHEDGYPTGKATKDYVETHAKLNQKIEFVLNELGDACSCGFVLSGAHILFTATFDTSKLNITIPQDYDYLLAKIRILDISDSDSAEVDLTMLDEYVKSQDNYGGDYGEGWQVENDVYTYFHEYNFKNQSYAQELLETLNNDLPISAFTLNLNYYKHIKAALKEVE